MTTRRRKKHRPEEVVAKLRATGCDPLGGGFSQSVLGFVEGSGLRFGGRRPRGGSRRYELFPLTDVWQ